MVDPNPARGMPLPLQRFWLGGKGAAKIRWRMPGDFNRCVRNLRKYFPKNPQGLCNILHQKAVGAPPGKGHGHAITASASLFWQDDMAALTAAAQVLLDKQPFVGRYTWAGPLAPIGLPTGEPRRTRVFEPGALNHRMLPLPYDWRERTGQGHEGSVTVGRILGIAYGPDHTGQEFAWGWGDYLDEEVFPDAKKARVLAELGVAGPSLDPGGKVMAGVNPQTGFEHYTLFGIGGATLVSIPAFAALRPYVFDGDADWPDDDPDMDHSSLTGAADSDCGCEAAGGVTVALGPVGSTFTVNSGGWRGLPLAARESLFDNDDAVKRISAWAAGEGGLPDVNKLRRAFMWHDPQLSETDSTSYRLPVGDIINGRLTLVYHAVYAAAALLAGAHGGLPSIDESDRKELRNVISEIYPEMARAFNDSSIRAPWDRSAQPGVQLAMEFSTTAEGFPLAPPKEWFDDPKLTRKTKMTVTEEGRVYGHLAAWNECHRDVTMRECVMAPKSQHEYAPFHLGSVLTAEGETVEVGKIVQDTRHASINLGYAAAALHYDNTGDEVAVIRCGEDEFGIWFAGSVVPEATRKKVAKLRRSPLSGDWRRERGSLELTAALAVNAPAFPVYAMEDDERLALVAAGSVWFDESDSDDSTIFTAPTGIDPSAEPVVDETAAFRGQRLIDLIEDEEIYAQRARASRLQQVFAADPGGAKPSGSASGMAAGVPAPAAPGGEVPSGVADAMAPEGDDNSGADSGSALGGDQDWVASAVEQQAMARYSVVEESGSEGEPPMEDVETSAPAQAQPNTPPPPAPATQ